MQTDNVWSCDFETTTDPTDCRVWAYACYNIYTQEFVYGNSIKDFLEWCFTGNNKTLYFHNLAFDGEFIIDALYRRGFRYCYTGRLKSHEFDTLITDDGIFYALKAKRNKVHISIYDSLKIVPLSVSEIPKAFGLEYTKGEIDYKQYREEGHIITDEELDYIKRDVIIVGKTLRIFRDMGLKKMTQSSNALQFYKAMMGDKFKYFFPDIGTADSFIRRAYKGGWTYLVESYAGMDIKEGCVFDANSLYPAMMYYKPMPYGEPIYFDGKYADDDVHPLYVQGIICEFELKPGKLPTIQLKNNYRFSATEYLKSSNGEEVYLCLTNIDLDLFFECYDVTVYEWCGGYKFRSTTELFKEYIDYWMSKKIDSKKSGNKGMYTISKYFLNKLYGKFGTNPRGRKKYPIYDEEEDRVKYIKGEEEGIKALYLPIAVFVTSWGRDTTIRAALSCGDRFIYADTDSLHLLGRGIPDGLAVDDSALGQWKMESIFDKARFLHAKCYIEYGREPGELPENNGLKVTVAGMPRACHKHVSFDNFKIGTLYPGKIVSKKVRGGTVLIDTEYTLMP